MDTGYTPVFDIFCVCGRISAGSNKKDRTNGLAMINAFFRGNVSRAQGAQDAQSRAWQIIVIRLAGLAFWETVHLT